MSCAVIEVLFETSRVCRLGEGLPTEGFRDSGSSLGVDMLSEDRLDKGVTLETSWKDVSLDLTSSLRGDAAR